MASYVQNPLTNGQPSTEDGTQRKVDQSRIQSYDDDLREALKKYQPGFHGDLQLADKQQKSTGIWKDLSNVLQLENIPAIAKVIWKEITTRELNMAAGSQIIGALHNSSKLRAGFMEDQVKSKYDKMLHPPLTCLGDAFRYRAADGKYNSVLHPHFGQAGGPYAKTVPSNTHVLGAQPDPGDIFDRVMARNTNTRKSTSGLSSMLIHHATIIIHDLFRTNADDKNISDTSSYLDLSPLYGYTEEMQRKVRDTESKRGLLKPDTFAEDRLLRQPPGVCILLVMYGKYHNYVVTQLRRINENSRFSISPQYKRTKPVAVAKQCIPPLRNDPDLAEYLAKYQAAWDKDLGGHSEVPSAYSQAILRQKIDKAVSQSKNPSEIKASMDKFGKDYDAAWNKVDDDLFNTARLITCGLYFNISIHDYLRALMGFHNHNTTFTLDPRLAIRGLDKKELVSRGLGNQVTCEFNLLYRLHCAISEEDELYTEDLIHDEYGKYLLQDLDPKKMTLPLFLNAVRQKGMADLVQSPVEPWQIELGHRGTVSHGTK